MSDINGCRVVLVVIVQAVKLLLCDRQEPLRGLCLNWWLQLWFCLVSQYVKGILALTLLPNIHDSLLFVITSLQQERGKALTSKARSYFICFSWAIFLMLCNISLVRLVLKCFWLQNLRLLISKDLKNCLAQCFLNWVLNCIL